MLKKKKKGIYHLEFTAILNNVPPFLRTLFEERTEKKLTVQVWPIFFLLQSLQSSGIRFFGQMKPS